MTLRLSPSEFRGLKDYQREHGEALLNALYANHAALDASDTGTGKTFVACWLARMLEVVPLVICPKSVVSAWREAGSGMGVELEVVNYEKARGVRRKFNVFHNYLCGPFIQRRAVSAWGREVVIGRGSQWRWNSDYEAVIFDEVHRCGGPSSLTSKLLISAKRQAGYVLALSATAADDPRQFKALGSALGLFTLDKYHFWLLGNGCAPGAFGGYDFASEPNARQKAFERIHRQIFPARGARMRKASIPNFPKTQVRALLVEDEDLKARDLVEEIRDEYIAAGADPAHAHLPAMIRAQQKLELLRVPALADLAADYALTSKVVLFVNYTATVDALVQALGKLLKTAVPFIDGRNPKERDALVDQFQRNRFPAIVANSQACGLGIGLHDPHEQTDRTALISPAYNAKTMKQTLGRLPRTGGGFSQQFFVYFADTLEAKIAAAVSQKFENLDLLNDATLHGVL